MNEEGTTPALLNRKALVKYTGIGYSTLNKLELKGQFPARREVTAGRVGWVRNEVDSWVNSLPARRAA